MKTWIIRKKIWDMIMLFAITRGFGGVVLCVQVLGSRWLARYGIAPLYGGCAV